MIPVYGYPGNASPAAVIATETNNELLPDGRSFLNRDCCQRHQVDRQRHYGPGRSGRGCGRKPLAGYDTDDLACAGTRFSAA